MPSIETSSTSRSSSTRSSSASMASGAAFSVSAMTKSYGRMRTVSTTGNGDVEIYYETFGDPANPTLLLINGLGSQCINYSVEWCEQFAAEGYQVVRFDNRDTGLS